MLYGNARVIGIVEKWNRNNAFIPPSIIQISKQNTDRLQNFGK